MTATHGGHERALTLVEQGRLGAAHRLTAETLTGTDDPKIHLTAAWIALDRGDGDACARHLGAAPFTGLDRARAHCLRGLLLCQQSTPHRAAAGLTEAVRALRRHGDRRWLANALTGRGIARAHALDPVGADADFTAAHAILTGLDEPARAAMCLHNRGFAAMLAGRTPAALRHYEQAAREGLRTSTRPEALVDRAQALLDTGLIREARDVLHPAVALLTRCDRGSRLPEALLLAARCALRDDDPRAARTFAEHAEALFTAQRRARWVPAAQAVALRAGRPGTPAGTARTCADQGHHDEAAELHLTAAPDRIPRHRGTPRSRAIGWLARARTATTRRAAASACHAGLRLHTPDTWPGTELTDTALHHALAGRDARSVVRWSERRRNSAPTPTAETALVLLHLRAARTRAEHARVVVLEREVRRLSLAAGTTRTPTARLDELAGALGDRALLDFVHHRGRLVAVSVVTGRFRLHDLGDARTTAGHATSLELKENRAALDHLDALLAPAGDHPLVIVPSRELARVPWAALPAARGRPVSVVPSATCWLTASRLPLAIERRMWVAGPNLRHAEQEITALRAAHGGERFRTVASALSGMARSDVVHIAAHGVRRTDLPLFSHVELADGPVHGYDFDHLRNAPSVVVLSACDSGLATTLVRRGVRAVIASVRPVPDDRVAALMLDLHAHLATPAHALARAQENHGDLGFTCVGAG
ncbi:CHAT domain-containing protein [Actinosynnema sp. NPDC023587]|uniref:CHAT domain-containing protein n=1 Tax=Actinosynnema sp. NPDC023587 TaxID=3154695 RepID=UPI00341004E6